MRREIEGDLRKVLKPYLGHWDVPDGGDLVLTIDKIYEEDVKNQHGTEQKPVMYFREPNVKPMIVNKTNNDSITKLYGKRTKKNNWSGKKIALYEAKEPKSADGLALRIRDYIPKQDIFICEDCGREITGHGKYEAVVIANRALTKFKRYLCYDCAQIAAEELEGTDGE